MLRNVQGQTLQLRGMCREGTVITSERNVQGTDITSERNVQKSWLQDEDHSDGH